MNFLWWMKKSDVKEILEVKESKKQTTILDEISKQQNEIFERIKEIEKQRIEENKLVLEEFSKITKERKIFISKYKELVSIVEELLENIDEIKQVPENKQELKERRKKDLEITNNNFKYLRNQIKDLNSKFEGVLEIIADKTINEEEVFPEITSSDLSLRKIMKMKNKNKSLIFSIVYMMKKYFDEKGVRI